MKLFRSRKLLVRFILLCVAGYAVISLIGRYIFNL